MFDFTLTAEQLALQKTVRDFVNREIKPVIKEREAIADPRQRFPWDIVGKLSRMGIRTLRLSRELGGGGADLITTCLVGEELCVGDLGIGVIFDQTWKFSHWFDMMTEEQRKRFLPDFLKDDTYFLASGMTEPDADKGYRYFEPSNYPGTQPKLTTARRDGRGGWVINGTKHYISNGSEAKLYTLYARTDLSKGGLEGVTAFLVPAGTPGFTIGRIEDKIGQRLINNAELIFQDCRVPQENILVGEGRAAALRAGMSRASNIEAAATTLGVGRAAYEAALEWAKTRIQGGKPIIQHEAIGMMLADMALSLEAARTLIWKAAWAEEHPEEAQRYLVDYKYLDPNLSIRSTSPLPSMAKTLASEVSLQVSIKAVEIFGGYGIMRDGPVEKCVRDSLTFLHSDRTNQIHRLLIGHCVGGYGYIP